MKHSKESKATRKKKVNRKYSGETSPYREWLDRAGDYNQEHEQMEPAEANPDVLAESDGLYYWKSDINEDQMKVVIASIPLLTKKQQMVLQYVGLEGKTLANVGAMMGLSRGNVLDLLNRARKTIKAQVAKINKTKNSREK